MLCNSQDDCLREYLASAPFALANERAMECRIYADLEFIHPVLDLGCGEGLFAKILFNDKIDTGIDLNGRALKRAKQLGAYRELFLCRGSEIPKPDESYNTIMSNSVLEHIPELYPVLLEVRRLLRPNGMFYFTVPTSNFDKYTCIYRFCRFLGLKKIADHYRRVYNAFWQHYHYYTPEQWKYIVVDAGFEIVDSFTYNSMQFCTANDLLAPMGLPGFLLKKIANRWVWFPSIRKIWTYPFFRMFRIFFKKQYRVQEGGLIFFSVRKSKQ